MKNKQFSRGLSQQLAPSQPTPHQHNDEEEFKPSPYLWAVTRVRSNDNIKDACEAISWDIQESGIQIRWKEYQSAELNAQIMIMCVPNIFDRVGLEEEVFWHLKDIKKSLIKKGTISSELIGIPLPEIKISWQQNKQGKRKSKAEKDLSLNNLVGFQQNGCMVCMVEAAEKDWKRLSILWEKFNKMGLCHRILGQNSLMVVNFNGQPTDSNRVTMQHLRRVNIIYAYHLSSAVNLHVAMVHKRVEVEMEDGSRPPCKFTDLLREAMALMVTGNNGTSQPAFDAMIPVLSGLHCGSAVLTYRTDSNQSAALARSVRRCVAGWFFGYWVMVCKYKESMVQKLMESFDTNSAHLARFSVFNPVTLEVQTGFVDDDELLEGVEGDLGINQGWLADQENKDGTTVDVVGHRKALAQTLRDHPGDIDDADHSGPSSCTDFSQSTGKTPLSTWMPQLANTPSGKKL